MADDLRYEFVRRKGPVRSHWKVFLRGRRIGDVFYESSNKAHEFRSTCEDVENETGEDLPDLQRKLRERLGGLASTFRYFGSKSVWPASREDLERLHATERKITRRYFLRMVGYAPVRALERRLGYYLHGKSGRTMAGDPLVTYHSATMYGILVYFIRFPWEEYVFVPWKLN